MGLLFLGGGLAEGFGLFTLLPVLELSMPGAASEVSGPTAMVAGALEFVGLPVTLTVTLGQKGLLRSLRRPFAQVTTKVGLITAQRDR